jgi:hypothetical protein
MAATFNWCEDNGTQTGSPLRGTTRSQSATPPTDVSWKSADDAKTASGGTLYSAAPIVAGQNSYTKYTYGQFTGTYNQILNGKWSAHTSPAGALATGLTLNGVVTSTYATPSQTTNAALTTDFTTAVAIGSGSAVQFAASGPENAAPGATLASGGGFTQYLATQLQTTVSAAAGDMASVTMTLQYDEN